LNLFFTAFLITDDGGEEAFLCRRSDPIGEVKGKSFFTLPDVRAYGLAEDFLVSNEAEDVVLNLEGDARERGEGVQGFDQRVVAVGGSQPDEGSRQPTVREQCCRLLPHYPPDLLGRYNFYREIRIDHIFHFSDEEVAKNFCFKDVNKGEWDFGGQTFFGV